MFNVNFFYTTFGEVYSGKEVNEIGFEKYTIIIQPDKLKEYQTLNHTEKTIDKIREYGWVLEKDVVTGIIRDDNFVPPKKQISPGEGWDMRYDRKTMFIFGAGASAHCVTGLDKEEFYKDEMRPPVGPALFEKRFEPLYNKFTGVKQSLHFLQGISNPDVEALFEEEWKQIQEHNNQSILSRHISIQYYLQNLLRDITSRITEKFYAHNLYAKLAYKLQCIQAANRTKKFAFVSFNQDTILEHFLEQQFSYSLNKLEDYCGVNTTPFSLFKPHGSWNWGWKFPPLNGTAINANWLFNNKKNFHQVYYELLGDHISMVDWNSYGHYWSLHKNYLGKYSIDKSKLEIIPDNILDGYFPALLLPYRDKDEFTMPLEHFYVMEHYFSLVETLVIIGWKGNEAAFTDQLTKHSARIKKLIIVDPQPKAVEQNLSELIKKQKLEVKSFDSFEDFVTKDIEKEIV